MLGSYGGTPPLAKRPRMDPRPFIKNEADFGGPGEGSNGPDPMGGGRPPGMMPMMGPPAGGGDFGGQMQMPTRVLQVRGLLDNTMEADLVEALSHFGPVSYVSLAGRGMGFVEFEDVSAAERCVNHSRTTDIHILGTPAYFNFANMHSIPRQGLESDRPSNVVIFYVQNAKYPITTDIVHAIVKPVARVNRIIINRQNGIQALVELDSIESARAVKQRLNGCDIYSGCCTLKIEYAKMQRLNVIRNDSDHCDYTGSIGPSNDNPIGFDEHGRPIFADSPGGAAGGMGMDIKPAGGGIPPFGSNMGSGRGGVGLMDDYQSAAQAQIAALNSSGNNNVAGGPPQQQHSQPAFIGGSQPPFGGVGSQSGMMNAGGGAGFGDNRPFPHGPNSMRQQESLAYQSNQHNILERGPQQRTPDGCSLGGENAVLMVYNLDAEQVNCDKLFNVFCLYGNVMRIKFLRSKNDTVMIQMGDAVAAQRAMECLNYCEIFGKKLNIVQSRQPEVREEREPADLPDKTSSYRDYSTSRLNRYLSSDIASKNRINPPQRVLYFFNAPPNITDDQMIQLLQEHKAPKATQIKVFAQRAGMAKNSAGLIEFETETDATEALMLANHASMAYEGSRHPFVLKLCFAGSANSSLESQGNDRGGAYGGNYEHGRGGGRDRDHGDRDGGRHRGGRSGYGGPGGGGDRRGESRERGRDGRGGGSGRGRGRGGHRGGY